MRTCRPGLLVLATLLGLAPPAHAHVGDQIYPFYELLDEDLDRIDLTDASVEDWIEVRRGALADGRRLLLPLLQLRSSKL